LRASLDVVVHLARGAGGVRRVDQIAVFHADGAGLVSCIPALTFTAGSAEPGPGHDHLVGLLSRAPAT
jgi:pilus assembly protein CpaF